MSLTTPDSALCLVVCVCHQDYAKTAPAAVTKRTE